MFTLTSRYGKKSFKARGTTEGEYMILTPSESKRAREEAQLVEGDYWLRATQDGEVYIVFTAYSETEL